MSTTARKKTPARKTTKARTTKASPAAKRKAADPSWHRDPEWRARHEAAKRYDQIFASFAHLRRFRNAPAEALARWPHAFLYAGAAYYGDSDKAWDGLEQYARGILHGPITAGDSVRAVNGNGAEVRGTVAEIAGDEVKIRPEGSKRIEGIKAAHCFADHPLCVEGARTIQRHLRWQVAGLVSLDPAWRHPQRPDDPPPMPDMPDYPPQPGALPATVESAGLEWARAACRLTITASENLGWGTDRTPRRWDDRSWHGATEGSTPDDPAGGAPKVIDGESLAFRTRIARPRLCESCGDLWFPLRDTGHKCPICAAKRVARK